MAPPLPKDPLFQEAEHLRRAGSITAPRLGGKILRERCCHMGAIKPLPLKQRCCKAQRHVRVVGVPHETRVSRQLFYGSTGHCAHALERCSQGVAYRYTQQGATKLSMKAFLLHRLSFLSSCPGHHLFP
jgi:hypothetical protein